MGTGKSVTGKIKEEMSRQTSTEKKLCPFAQDPLDDCYITNMVSQNTEAVINYCGGNFKECEVYKGNVKGNHWTK